MKKTIVSLMALIFSAGLFVSCDSNSSSSSPEDEARSLAESRATFFGPYRIAGSNVKKIGENKYEVTVWAEYTDEAKAAIGRDVSGGPSKQYIVSYNGNDYSIEEK